MVPVRQVFKLNRRRFLPSYGYLEGVYLLAAHRMSVDGFECACVGIHVEPCSERIPVCRRSFRPESAASHRRCSLSVLFVHRDADVIESCLEELKKARFTVSAIRFEPDTVYGAAHSQSYDVVVAEYPSPSWKGPQALQLLRQTVQEIPLLFVTTGMGSESIAQLIADGAFDYVEREHIAQLPMAVRRS